MDNPWHRLPTTVPYVVPEDRPHVEAFNELFGGGDGRYRLDPRLHPEPFMGRRDADLVLLARNPGISPGDYAVHTEPRYLRALRANLEDDPAGHVVTALIDEFADTPAGCWWRPRLRQLAEHCGSEEELARRILIVEFHGYHSKNWRPVGVTLPTQAFGFSLVANAVRRRATILITRGADDWSVAVPAIRAHDRVYRLNSHRNSAVSVGNLGPKAFERVLAALDR